MDEDVPMTPSFTEDPLLGELIAARYRIHEVIGEGGAGRVYRAVQEAMGREVAIKMVRYDMNAETRREFSSRFAREAALLGRLAHPNVVTVHDYGATDAGEQYVVMELLRGQSLKDAIREGPLEAHRAADIAEQIARGLSHAHAAGLIHRDIKPSNVHVVDEGDGRERAIILDFGLVKAKEHNDEVTRTGTYMGTPAYTAPEQARGDPTIDHRADIYALGIVLYRMLAGAVPFQGQNPMGTVILHITEPYPPIAQTNPDVRVDPALEDIVRKAMAKSPDDRFQDAAAMARALEAWRAGHPLPLAPPRKRGWAVPLLGGLGAGLIAMLAAGGSVLLLVIIVVLTQVPRPAPPAPRVPVMAPATPPSASPPPATATAPLEPTHEPKPVPVPAHEPKPVPAPKPIPHAPPDAKPPPVATPAPVSAPSTGDGLTFDNITFDSPAHIAASLKWVNGATEQQLRDARIYDKGVIVILTNRPFATMQKFSDTSGIGEATMRDVAAAGKH